MHRVQPHDGARLLTLCEAGESPGRGIFETLRVLRLVDPGFDTTCLLTFEPGDGPAEECWRAWWVDVFSAQLLHVFAGVIEAAAREHAHDILAFDREMDAAFDEVAGTRSRILGWRLLVDYRPPVGARALGKLRTWALEGGRGLHFASVFGVRCGVFNIPVPQAASAYLYKEWHCGHRGHLPLGEGPPLTGMDLAESHSTTRFFAP